MKKFLTFIIIFTLIPIFSFGKACQAPTKRQFQNFFDNESSWAAVKVIDKSVSTQLAELTPIFVDLNFSNPEKNTARLGNRVLSGEGVPICFINSSQMRLITPKGNFLVKKRSSGVIQIMGYYLRPSHQVQRIEKHTELLLENSPQGPATRTAI